MRELHLFAGIGGGILASQILKHEIIGAVEINEYCQKVLAQRQSDGILPKFPIFTDIRTFISSGCAELYRGVADCIHAGFPCQPFSVAGKRKGEQDERNMWPATIDTIRIIRPRLAFLENVPGLLTDKYMGRIFGDLAESGYQFRWTCLGADDVGANHKRKRLCVLAYSDSDSFGRENGKSPAKKSNKRGINALGGPKRLCEDVADPKIAGQQGFTQRPRQMQPGGNGFGRVGWWNIEPDVGRVVASSPVGVEQLIALGNIQVPLQMAYAFSVLSKGVIE